MKTKYYLTLLWIASTSADKEDHVSMGTIAARKLGKIIDNVEAIVAMEVERRLDLCLPKSGSRSRCSLS